MQILENKMGAQYETSVRAILAPKEKIPTFHSKLWSLDPDAVLRLNLDNYVNTSYAQQKTGLNPKYYTAREVFRSKDSIGGTRKLIVDLHGNLDNPKSWILTRRDIDSLLDTPGYTEFLESMFSHKIVIFYGIGVDDVSVSGQLEYLKDIEFVNGEYYLLKPEPSAEDLELSKKLPVQFIYMGAEFGWERGFENFVDSLLSFKTNETDFEPLKTSTFKTLAIPSPEEILTLKHDEIRKVLSSATAQFFEGNDFNYKKYKEFCEKYDSAIHLSTRIPPNSANIEWLGNKITGEIGRGNFGRVYAATNENEQSIAIKVAHADVRDDEAMLNSFRRGVASMKMLSESGMPGVVRIIDASELPPSILMEYLDGIDLEKLVKQSNSLDNITKIRIIKWVSEILFECHSHENVILHRDLRPSNIMIGGEYWDRIYKNDITVLDFDLSWFKGAVGAEFYMNDSQALGYLAPEQINVSSRYQTKSALVDVYGLGMLMYFVLSADIPVANASTRTDWPEKVERAARTLFVKDWKSSVTRMYRLLTAMTLEKQDLRPPLQYVMSEIDTLISILEGNYALDDDSVIEELISRLHGIDVHSATRFGDPTRIFTSGAGVKVTLNPLVGRISCTIEYLAQSSADRVHLATYLEQALSKAKSAVKKISEIDQKRSLVHLGGSKLYFTMENPKNIKQFNEIHSSVADAIVEISLNN